MFFPQIITARLPKVCLGFVAICLMIALISATLTSSIEAQSKKSIYGLGIPKSHSGRSRCPGPLLILLAPEDGASTISPRPTFYWYFPANSGSTKGTLDFILRENSGIDAKRIFAGRVASANSGIHKLILPTSAPALVVGKTQRWQLRWQSSEASSEFVNQNAYIVLEKATNDVERELSVATTDLAKARTYGKLRYWYDAFDAYSKWIDANPNDLIARKERQAMLATVFNDDFSLIAIAKTLPTKSDENSKIILLGQYDDKTLAEFARKDLLTVRATISKFLAQVDAAPAILETLKPLPSES